MKPRSWLKSLAWLVVALVGAACLAVVAFARGEAVNTLWLVVASCCVFAVAYRFHSAWLMAKVLTLDDTRITPAVACNDGRDFVPTNKWVVFGHHFAAIAGPGPLVGPVLAAQFGYLPGTLWILIGATLGGAVHDCLVMFASIRRGGKSLAEIVRAEIGTVAGFIALLSVLSILIIIIAVLGFVVVKALAESSWGLFTIAMTIPIAMLMGGSLRYLCPKRVGWVSALGVAGLLISVWAGGELKGNAAFASLFTLSEKELAWAIILYGLAASTLPVWLLLAPRDYLSSYLKIGTIAALAAAIIYIAPVFKMPALTQFSDGTGPIVPGGIFPFCFITIACGAISGFHAVISSGTTPKLICNERDIRLVGYGGMITEMLVSIMALIAACSMEPGQYFAINMKGDAAAVCQTISQDLHFPVTPESMDQLAKDLGEEKMIGRVGGAPTFAVGMAMIFAKVIHSKHALALWYHFAIMFEALFILTTIDAGTRVGRFLMQDFLGKFYKPLGMGGGFVSNVFSSLLFVGAWGYFLFQGVVDPLGGIRTLWPIFGVSNQLLAVVALATGATVLIKMRKTRYLWVALLPLTFLLAVTMTAGVQKIFSDNPKVGFLSEARQLTTKIEAIKPQLEFAGAGAESESATRLNREVEGWKKQRKNAYVNITVTSLLLALVVAIVTLCGREWWLLLSGRKPMDASPTRGESLRVVSANINPSRHE